MKEKLKREIDEYLNERVPEVIKNIDISRRESSASKWKYDHIVTELISGTTPKGYIFDELVREYQHRNELYVDGIVGPKTLMMLKYDIEFRTKIQMSLQSCCSIGSRTNYF